MSQRSLANEQDVRESQRAGEGGGSSFRLSIPDRRTAWFLLSLNYFDGFVHYAELPDKTSRRVVCLGPQDLTGGFAPDDCPLCAKTLLLYKRGKALRSQGANTRGNAMKHQGNDMRAKYEARFVAVRGTVVATRENGKKKWVADFDFDAEDDDERAAVGILSLSPKQFHDLTEMVKDEQIPYLKTGKDLGNRILYTKKERSASSKGGGQDYKTVKWSADPQQSEAPELPEDIDLDSIKAALEDSFTKDEEAMEKIQVLLGIGDDEVEEEEEEPDVADADEPDDSFFEDDEEEEEKPKKKSKKRKVIEEDSDEEDEEDEDDEEEDKPQRSSKKKSSSKSEKSDEGFLDDIPGDDDEEEEEKPHQKRRRKASV